MTVPIPTEFEPSRFFRITTKPKEKALLKKREIFIRKLAAIALPPVGPVALRRLLSRVVPFTWEENHLYTAIKVHLPADFFALLVDPVKKSARHFFIVTAIGRRKTNHLTIKQLKRFRRLLCVYGAPFASRQTKTPYLAVIPLAYTTR